MKYVIDVPYEAAYYQKRLRQLNGELPAPSKALDDLSIAFAGAVPVVTSVDLLARPKGERAGDGS